MSDRTIAPSTQQFHQQVQQFHQQVEETLSYQPNHVDQLTLFLPRFHFGDFEAAAIRDQRWRWETREQRRDLEEIEQEEAAENERLWREAIAKLPEMIIEELINQNGGVL